ncbi:oxidoreductase [Acrasis kona]|uniref:Oxidoreductase n=1 Tax=Acrasis kona TaxID=1008807 RepID=A0AAW2YYJ3_9EUKA
MKGQSFLKSIQRLVAPKKNELFSRDTIDKLNMKGRVVLITGADRGIGFETVKRFAKSGAKVVGTFRDSEKGYEALKSIYKDYPDSDVELIKLNLLSFNSVNTFVTEFQKKHDKLHYLINNAGTLNNKFMHTINGYETNFQVNYLSPFLLTNSLVDQMIDSADKTKKGDVRVINLTDLRFTRLANMKNYTTKFVNEEVYWNSEEIYEPRCNYFSSKLAMAMYTKQLVKVLEEHRDNDGFLSINCVYPGFADTHLYDRVPTLRPNSYNLKKYFLDNFPTAEDASYLVANAVVSGNGTATVITAEAEPVPIENFYDECEDPEDLWDRTRFWIDKKK